MRASRFCGTVVAPGDKSISHRALILAALARGRCELTNLAPGADVRSTAACLRSLGAQVQLDQSAATVTGGGLSGLKAPNGTLDCGNSGTTIRLLCGAVAGSGVGGALDGDESLRRRPMKRVLDPLRLMGAEAEGSLNARGEETAPLRFQPGRRLVGKRHELAIASAQVKSCLLLAGLWADGQTVIREPHLSRDHSERMLRAFGASVQTLPDGGISIEGQGGELTPPENLHVPGDPSSAAFFIAAALMVQGQVEVRSVDVNPTRVGFLNVLRRMGAEIELTPEADSAGDPVASMAVRKSSKLKCTEVLAAEIPALLDELPILSVLATQAQGLSRIRGAAELRYKESDRIAQMARGLSAMGAVVRELDDGLEIHGPSRLRGARIDSMSDHRIAMSFAIAGLAADGETVIDGAEWADISFPGFFELLSQLSDRAVSVSGVERGAHARDK
ncbi:MAG TPA: 3-phosphoshikimate 1-carboxyvinyltransferase [Myxococcaceae bacterium]|nr:3-phosphoshikimate 1-carboxyvinyltransferase [Myxococcaceae bacterium]